MEFWRGTAVFGCPASPEQRQTSPECMPTSNGMVAHMKRNACPHPTESILVQLRRARNEMMLLDILFTLFLTHVGNLTTVRINQRRFAPTPAHITGIRCPLRRNTQRSRLNLQSGVWRAKTNESISGLQLQWWSVARMVKWVKLSGGFCLSGRLVTKRSQSGHRIDPNFCSKLVRC